MEQLPIVVGVDGSESSIEACRWAIKEARLRGSRLKIVTAWNWPSGYGYPMPMPPGLDLALEAKRVQQDVLGDLGDFALGVEIEEQVVQGHPYEVLVRVSRDAAMLVVGHRGFGEFLAFFVGSVTERVVAHAHCPVVVVRTAS
jgi:nucleotide-binding universal stress UspA family protein